MLQYIVYLFSFKEVLMSQDKYTSSDFPLTYKWGTRINFSLLIIHIGYFILFIALHINIMAILNVFSLILYSINFFVFKTRPWLGIKLIYIELLVHYLMAVQCVGWNAGFQNYCFTSIVVAYFIGYALKQDGYNKFNPNHYATMAFIIFFICWLESEYRIQVYTINESVSKAMHFVNDMLNIIILGEFARIFTINILTEKDMLIHTAEVDELTGLSNRHHIRRMCNFYHLGEKNGQMIYSIAIIDIDNFKRVNDSYGHNTGDYVLQKLADILKPHISPNTIIGRWGGEEFIIICIGQDSYNSIKKLSENIRINIQNTAMDYEDYHFNITVSIGIDGTTVGDSYIHILENADANLYKAKESGKNKVIYS